MKQFNIGEEAKNEKGVSLVELMVVASMLIVVLGAVLAVIDSTLGSYLYQSHRVESADKARQGMIEVVKEIRQAERPLLLPIYIPNNDLRFKADLDGNGTIEAIRYYLESGQLKRMKTESFDSGTGEPIWPSEGVVRISNVVNNPNTQPIFVFTTKDGGSPTSENIRVVRIHLFVDTNPGKPPSAVELTTDVQLRNFAQY